MDILQELGREQMEREVPKFRAGDTVRVYVQIADPNAAPKVAKPGKKEKLTRIRPQMFEGVVIRRKAGGVSSTFTVRKMSYGVGVERIFPVFSPRLERIEVVRYGKVRRAKLYFLRTRVGRAARLKELRSEKR